MVSYKLNFFYVGITKVTETQFYNLIPVLTSMGIPFKRNNTSYVSHLMRVNRKSIDL